LSRVGATLKCLAAIALVAVLAVLSFASPGSAHDYSDAPGPPPEIHAAHVAACTGPAAELPKGEGCRAGCCGLACCPSLILPPPSIRELFWLPLHEPLAGEPFRASLVPEIFPPPPKRPS
jgi:hypothetical protein